MRQVIYVWVATLILLLSGCASAPQQNDGIHRIVIQVSTDDPRTQTMALNNAINIKGCCLWARPKYVNGN